MVGKEVADRRRGVGDGAVWRVGVGGEGDGRGRGSEGARFCVLVLVFSDNRAYIICDDDDGVVILFFLVIPQSDLNSWLRDFTLIIAVVVIANVNHPIRYNGRRTNHRHCTGWRWSTD